MDTWLEPVAHSVEEASGGLAVFSILASLAAAGSGIARRLGALPPTRRPAGGDPRAGFPGRRTRSSTSSGGTRPTTPSSIGRPRALASWLLGAIEGPIVLRSLGGLGTGVRDVSDRVAAAQTGRVRGYALALAVGLAVLAIVFLVVA